MEQIKLTSSEWNVLNCLWERSPRTVMQIVEELEQAAGWARRTTITTLHRMEAKDLVRCEQTARGKAYVPLVEREQAALVEKRVSAGLRYALWAVVLVLTAALACACAFVSTEETAPELDLDDLSVDLSLSLEQGEDGAPFVRISGTVDGEALPRGATWNPADDEMDSYPYGYLSMVDPDLTDGGIEGHVTASWVDGDRTQIALSTKVQSLFSSYASAGWWEFTVDVDGWVVTSMKAMGESTLSAPVKLYPAAITDEEAGKAARVAAKLLVAAEDYYHSSAPAADDQRQPDLNRNGVPEDLRVITSDDEVDQRLEVWENEELLWSEEWSSSSHAGWAGLFLCTLDGEDYLLRYTPTMYGGVCDYTYTLFTLSADGEPQAAQENHIEADANIGSPVYTGHYDPEAFAAFMEEINGLLSHSVQLLNTDPALSATFEQEGRLYDSLWWLDSWEEYSGFTRDPSKSLLENLRDFRTAMDSARGFQPSGSPVPEETWIELQALFADGQFWYSQVLTGEFRTPEEIDLRELFYGGIPGVDNTLQADERAYLETVWSDEFQLDIARLPADQMDAVLQTYLGISLADTRGNGLDTLAYWAGADCYYLSRGDTNAIQVLPCSAYVQEDGTIHLGYIRSSFDADAASEPEWVAVLQPTGSGYWIVSNQPVSE